MLKIEENKDLSALSTFRMLSNARYFVSVASKEDLPEAFAFAESKNLPAIILGGGSNTVFAKDALEALVIQISILGTAELSDAVFKVGAGEEWDSFVKKTVESGYSGIEALSAIPGSVGGTPVQNVGAYGQEVSNVILSVEAYDRKEKKFATLSNADCKFAYRDSMFKHDGKDRYVITSVTFKLSQNPPVVPKYPGVAENLAKKGISNPTLSDIRETIIEIRQSKLPDPKDIASVGSFFKNPIVPKSQADALREKFPNAVIFPMSDSESKIGAGWMLESLGFRGKDFGNLMCYSGNAMVIVNKGGATPEELTELVKNIQRKVKEKFSVQIEPEPILIA